MHAFIPVLTIILAPVTTLAHYAYIKLYLTRSYSLLTLANLDRFRMLGGIAIGLAGSHEMESRAAQLRQSARTVTACLTRDEQQIPDPWDLLQSSYSRDYLPPGSAGEMHLQVRQVHVIPDILMAQFEGQECQCFMGLFAEIGRVIIDVALVKPKADIFVSSIKYLLVVVTAAEIVLLGLSFNSTGTESDFDSDLVIHRTGLCFPSDEINMLSIIGTRTGRIFAGGQDGNLYEFTYQSNEGWFTRKCRKVNKTSSALSYFTPTFLRMAQSGSAITSLTYDSGRDLLYSLGEDSSIQAFHLGKFDNAFEKIGHLSDALERASSLCPTGVLNKKTFKITSISAVEAQDSAFVHLVAITNCGAKLYFTTLKRDERAYSRSQVLSSQSLPSAFEMIHVRLPAEEGRQKDARRMVNSWNPNIHTAMYKNGVMLAASAVSDQEDLVLATIINQSVAMTSGHGGSLECATEVRVEGKIWDIEEIPQNFLDHKAMPKVSASFIEATSPLVSNVRRFLLLSNAGVYSLTKSTPVEELQKILVESNGNMEGEHLRHFFESYSADQACFLSIVLSCSVQSTWKSFGTFSSRPNMDSKMSANLALWSVNAIIRHGGEPRVAQTTISGVDYIGTGATGSILNLPAYGSRIEYEFSHLHRGLYLYFARLVGAFWNSPIQSFLEPNTDILMALHTYCEFLERNPGLASRTLIASNGPPRHVVSREIQIKLEEAYAAENQSIRTLVWLVKATLELLSFLSICRDYHILEPVLKSSHDMQKIEFEELIATPRGRDLVSDIAAALVQKQLKMKASVDSLCQILLQRCPTFFGEGEIVTFQGTECLERALQTRDSTERNLQLQESLKFFLRGCSSMSLASLAEISQKYQSLAFFPGLVELCLCAAQSRDVENIALAAFRTPNIQLNTQQQEIINLREGIYSLIFEALRAVHGIEARTISALVGQLGKSFLLWLILDVERLQKETLGRAIKSKDELFHLKLYDWLVLEHLGTLLLDLETPYLLHYLESRFIERVPAFQDFFWKYLARNGRYIDAAKVLDQLASSPEFKLNLQERIERLSLALGNARSEAGMTLEAAEYIQDLEERLDVAKLQNEVLENVISQYGEVAEVSDLNCVLFDISQLFNRFARPLKLHECSLRIIHCSSYQDPLLVHQLWTSILEKSVAGKHFDALAQKVAEIAKRLYPSPFSFPLNSVLVMAIKGSQSEDWVASTFIHSGIPTKDTLEQLCEFAYSPSSFWANAENRSFLFSVFTCVAEKGLTRQLIKSADLSMIINYLLKADTPEPQLAKLSLLKDRCK